MSSISPYSVFSGNAVSGIAVISDQTEQHGGRWLLLEQMADLVKEIAYENFRLRSERAPLNGLLQNRQDLSPELDSVFKNQVAAFAALAGKMHVERNGLKEENSSLIVSLKAYKASCDPLIEALKKEMGNLQEKIDFLRTLVRNANIHLKNLRRPDCYQRDPDMDLTPKKK